MSVRDLNKSIIITDALTGKPLQVLDFNYCSYDSLDSIILDYVHYFLYDNDNGLLIRVGSKN